MTLHWWHLRWPVECPGGWGLCWVELLSPRIGRRTRLRVWRRRWGGVYLPRHGVLAGPARRAGSIWLVLRIPRLRPATP